MGYEEVTCIKKDTELKGNFHYDGDNIIVEV